MAVLSLDLDGYSSSTELKYPKRHLSAHQLKLINGLKPINDQLN